MIGVVAYGLGNVEAFLNSYRRLGIPATAVSTAEELERADRLILPGVGAFDWAMSRLEQSGMRGALRERVMEDRVPVLGVCVGMQMMADRSEEGAAPGLGWIPGEVKRFREEWFSQKTHVPHMGWNDVEVLDGQSIFSDVGVAPWFYFLHSYYFQASEQGDVIGRTRYGVEFASAIRRGNIWATQFHPEKSHAWGMALLKNFAGI